MAIPVESPEARELRYFSNNPQFTKEQPSLKVPQNARIDSVELYRPDGKKAVSTNIQYRVEVRVGRSGKDYEPRWATLAAEKAADIFDLAKQPGFRVQQLVVENPSADEKDWRAHIWQKPREQVFYQYGTHDNADYALRLMQGQIPWIDISRLGGGYYGALSRIAADNSVFMNSSEKGLGNEPITKEDLMGISDKYDHTTPYFTRYGGLLLNFINLPRSDLLAFGLLSPSQRVEYLAITDPREQADFLNNGVNEGYQKVAQKNGREDAALMVDLRRRMTSPNNPTSHNDMEQFFNRLTKGRDYLGAVISKLVYAANLPSSKIVTLTLMEPPNRLATLIQEDEATKDALLKGANQIRSQLLNLPAPQARPVSLWMNSDKLRAA